MNTKNTLSGTLTSAFTLNNNLPVRQDQYFAKSKTKTTNTTTATTNTSTTNITTTLEIYYLA